MDIMKASEVGSMACGTLQSSKNIFIFNNFRSKSIVNNFVFIFNILYLYSIILYLYCIKLFIFYIFIYI